MASLRGGRPRSSSTDHEGRCNRGGRFTSKGGGRTRKGGRHSGDTDSSSGDNRNRSNSNNSNSSRDSGACNSFAMTRACDVSLMISDRTNINRAHNTARREEGRNLNGGGDVARRRGGGGGGGGCESTRRGGRHDVEQWFGVPPHLSHEQSLQERRRERRNRADDKQRESNGRTSGMLR